MGIIEENNNNQSINLEQELPTKSEFRKINQSQITQFNNTNNNININNNNNNKNN